MRFSVISESLHSKTNFPAKFSNEESYHGLKQSS